MSLSRQDYIRIDEHIRYHRARIESGQLKVSSSVDMAAFVSVRLRFGGYAHPVFDPAHSVFPPGGAFWLAVTDHSGQIVACTATRRFDNARLADLFLSRQVWYSREPIIDAMETIELDWPRDVPEIEGVLAIHGGLVVDPSLRGQKVGIHLVRMIRAVSVRTWRQSWNFGLVRDDLKAAQVQSRLYGYPHTVCCFSRRPAWSDGRPGPTHDREWLNYISLREMLDEYSRAPDTLLS